MATTNGNNAFETSDVVTDSAMNVDSSSGVIALTSETNRNVTSTVEFTKFTDSALAVANNAAVTSTHIDDLEDIASVVSFLKRPCLLYYSTQKASAFKPLRSFDSTEGWARQPYFKKFNVPQETLKFGKRIEKITNFEWFKADTVFRVMTTVNPHIAGRLWVAFAPYDQLLEQECRILYKGRAAITSYPGVEIDLQSSNAAEIRIPWSGLSDAMSLTNAEDSIGTFYIFALTPIVCDGDPDIPLQVFSHFENITINGPTPLKVVLQGAKKEAPGPIQEISGTVKNLANNFKDILAPIPIVGTIASVAPWVAGAVEGVASIFGWSRPVSGSGSQALVNIPGRGYAQVKCEDSSTMLALANDNEIVEKEVNFLEDIDEMQVEHICRRPALVTSVQWGVNNAPLTEIAILPVGPFIDSSRISSWTIGSKEYTTYDMTLFEQLASHFVLWKADMHYRISVVRTPFHIGRFEVFFVPRAHPYEIGDVSQIDSTNLYRHIVDISETNEIEFVIPYMHQMTMCPTGKTLDGSGDFSNVESPGTLVIRALSPLSCISSVGQRVFVNIWSWATNVALAGPVDMGLKTPPLAVTLQGIVRNEEMGVNSIVFGKTNNPEDVLKAGETVGGELMLNLRSATRAHRQFDNTVGNKTLFNPNPIGNHNGYLGLAANIFAFFRGGISIKFVPKDLSKIGYVKTRLAKTDNDKVIPSDSVSHITFTNINPFHEVQVPYYHTTRRALCNRKFINADQLTSVSPGVFVETNVGDLDTYIGAKDDLTFGYLIGGPVMSMSPQSTKPFKADEVEVLPKPVKLQGFQEQTTSDNDVIRGYYGTTKLGREYLRKFGFNSKRGVIKFFKDKGQLNHGVIYELEFLRSDCQDCGDYYVITDDTANKSIVRSVTLFGSVVTLNKVILQGLSDYNPFGIIKKGNQLLDSANSIVGSGIQSLDQFKELLSKMKLTLFGKEVHGVLFKLVRILINALMAQRNLLVYNFIFNIMLDFGSEIYYSVLKALGINTVVQGFSDLIDLGNLKQYVDKNRGICALTLSALMATALLAGLGLCPGDFNKRLKNMGDRSRSLKNIFDYSSVGTSLFGAVSDEIIASIFGSKKVPELDEYLAGYKEWSDEVLELNEGEEPLSVLIERDEKLVFKINKLFKQGVNYSTVLGSNRLSKEVSVAHYNKCFKIIEEARKLCDYTGVFGNRPRVKPIVVQLFGESGVGKSGMSWPLACDLNAMFASTDEDAVNFSKDIYFRNSEQEFWDGYAGQNIVCYDDFGQRVDGALHPNEEYMELIRCSNIAPYPLHMAGLEDKKRTKFCSMGIILTSNVLNQNVGSLTFPDAYRRRVDVCAKISNKEEYTMGGYSYSANQRVARLDPTKCNGPADTEVYLISLYNAETMSPMMDKEGKPLVMNYEQFVEHCAKMARYNYNASRDFNKQLENRMIARAAKMRSLVDLQGVADYLDYVPAIKDRFIRIISEYATLKNVLIMAGILIAGIGAWQWSSYKSTINKHHKGDIIKFVNEASTSGDQLTRNSKTLIREATVSGDLRTVKNKVVKTEAKRFVENRNFDDVTYEATASGDLLTKRTKVINLEADLDMQAWRDTNAQDLITNRIVNNLYRIRRVRNSTETNILQCLFIRDTVALAPRHLQASLLSSDEIIISNIMGSEYRLPVSEIKFYQIEPESGYDKDAILLKFPRYVNAHSDLVKHFQTMPELSVRRSNVCIPTVREYAQQNTLTILGNSMATMSSNKFSTEVGELNIRDSISYDMPTKNGDCGSPIICQESSFIRKIAGIHIAALTDGTMAFGQSITQKDLLNTLNLMKDVVVTDYDQLPNMELRIVQLQTNEQYSSSRVIKLLDNVGETFNSIGVCSKPVFVPSSTDIEPSLLQGKLLPCTTAPSVLYSKDEDVMEKNFRKNSINTPFIDKSILSKSVHEVKLLLLKDRNPQLSRILTYEEAIAGSEESIYLGSLNRQSSAGYPWVLDRKPGKPGKTGWFGDDMTYIFDETVKRAVQYRIDQAKLGVRIPTVWSATLKDERRPIEKVKLKKTRVFASGPQDYTIAFRMYFLGFMANIMENRIKNEQSVGTNPYGVDWTLTAKKLKSKGNKVFAGDFSSFDGTLNSNIMSEFVKVVNEYYNDGETNARIREVLFLDVFNSIQLVNGKFLSLTHSQPSGNPSTTILNSFYNSVSMRVAYYLCAQQYKIKPPTFSEVVSMVSYGDDNVINFSDEIVEWFNQQTVTVAFDSFGMIYTDESKSNSNVKYKSLDEVRYLKRAFRKLTSGLYRAPAPLEVIMETPNWVRKSPDIKGATLENCSNSLMELAGYEREIYDKYSRIIIDAAYQNLNEYPEHYTYEEQNSIWDQEIGLIDEP